MADTADRILADLRRRRDELKPLVDELQRIESAIDALERAAGEGGSTKSRSKPTTGNGRRRGRPRKGEPNRTDQFLDLVREGGTSISAAAKALGIAPNYLYRIAGTLEREGTIQKQGREYKLATGNGSDLVTDEGVNQGAREIAGD